MALTSHIRVTITWGEWGHHMGWVGSPGVTLTSHISVTITCKGLVLLSCMSVCSVVRTISLPPLSPSVGRYDGWYYGEGSDLSYRGPLTREGRPLPASSQPHRWGHLSGGRQPRGAANVTKRLRILILFLNRDRKKFDSTSLGEFEYTATQFVQFIFWSIRTLLKRLFALLRYLLSIADFTSLSR